MIIAAKLRIWRAILAACILIPSHDYCSEAKNLACNYSIAKDAVTSALAEGGCGRWVAKPQEEANFYAEDVNNNIGESNTYCGESNTYCGEDDNSGTDVNEGIRN